MNEKDEILEYLYKNYSRRSFRLGELKKFGNINLITKKFKEENKISIIDYIIELRVEKAKELVKKGISSKEIAIKLGWGSISNFNRQFKIKTNLTPREFKEKEA